MGDRRTDEDIERDWENIKAITGMNDQPEVLTDDELIAALRERLAALVEDVEGKLPAGVADYDDQHYCIYCDAIDVYELSDHAPDCPIALGREQLAKGANDGE